MIQLMQTACDHAQFDLFMKSSETLREPPATIEFH